MTDIDQVENRFGYVSDAMNFSTYFAASPASQSTPHLYISCLAAWSGNSAIARKWSGQFRHMPLIQAQNWKIVQLMSKITNSQVGSVGFSPDRTRIVFGSSDKSVRVWDASSGEEVKRLDGHTHYVTSVAFSPDGDRKSVV